MGCGKRTDMKSSEKAGLLSDIVVLDLSKYLPGPFCSMILADQGARVISIENTNKKGNFLADFPLWTVNRNKERMEVNLKTGEGRGIFLKLAGKADVIIEQFRPSVPERLGVDYETIRKINPGIIYCSITGYGQTGKKRMTAGHDLNYLCASGAMEMFTGKNGVPMIPAVQIADLAGSLYAAVGILMALHHRQKTGMGRYIDISMADAALSLLVFPFTLLKSGLEYKSGNSLLSHGFACYNFYRTKDNKYLAVGALEPHFFREFCRIIGIEKLCGMQFMLERQLMLKKKIQKIIRSRTCGEWINEFEGKDVCVSEIVSFEDALKDKDFLEHGMIKTMKNDTGEELPILGSPLKCNGRL
jgi:crotonobetainyl-CoA:carnitine CoA-transferase CaiB-like acyl-CoA transferase